MPPPSRRPRAVPPAAAPAALPAALLALALALPVAAPAAEGPACDPADQLPCLCADFEAPSITASPCFVGDINRQVATQTDALAANIFAALHWPMGETRAAPDLDAARRGDSTVVLDGWKSTRDIFRRDGRPPVPWDSDARALPAACRDLDLAAEKAKVPFADSIPDDLSPRLLDEYLNPQGHPLVDAAGRPTRYEVMFNRQAYDYVADNRLWEASALDAFIAEHGGLSFPMGRWTRSEADHDLRGALVAKAAWKILDASDDPDAFHKSWAYVTPLIENAERSWACALRPVGLVGLHVAAKLQELPDWLWATYTHESAAPLWSEIGRTRSGFVAGGLKRWLYYSHPAEGAAPLNRPPDDPLSDTPSRLVRDYPDGYYYAPIAGDAPSRDCGPFSFDFHCFNRRLAEGFPDSPVSRYRLLGTQWVTPPNQGAQVTPEILGNPVLESYMQTRSSCVGCHSHANPPGAKGAPGLLDSIFSMRNDVFDRLTPVQQSRD